MDTVNAIFGWLEAREGVLSALAALAAIIGISYGILSFMFPSIGRKVKKFFGHQIDEQFETSGRKSSLSRQFWKGT